VAEDAMNSGEGKSPWRWLLRGGAASEVIAGVALAGPPVVAAFLWFWDTSVPGWALMIGGLVMVAGAGLFAWQLRRTPKASVEHETAPTTTLVGTSDAESDAVPTVAIEVGYFLALNDALHQLNASRSDPLALESAIVDVRKQLFDRIRNSISGTVKCTYVKPRLVDVGNRQERFLMTAEGYHSGHKARVEQRRLHADRRTLAGRAFEAVGEKPAKPQYSEDTRSDDWVEKFHEIPDMRSLFCAPTFALGDPREPAAVLCVSSTLPSVFAETDRMFILLCASLIAAMDLLGQTRA
jgi:hypothetical protein